MNYNKNFRKSWKIIAWKGLSTEVCSSKENKLVFQQTFFRINAHRLTTTNTTEMLRYLIG